MSEPRRCAGTNALGEPCQSTTPKGRQFCVWHDPALAEDRERWRREGGHNRANAVRARKELEEVEASVEVLPAILMRTLRRVERGEISPAMGNAIASIVRTFVAVHDAVEVERRLTALEHMHGDRKGYAA